MYKKDCFAYKNIGRCKALMEMECENCKFYLTESQYLEKIKILEKEGK